MLISLQILAKMFASNVIINLSSYNLSNYIATLQFEVFENCLKWVAYITVLRALTNLLE